MTPEELARELGISPKTLRAWLRAHIERGAAKGTRWGGLDQATIQTARARWSRSAPRRPPAPSSARARQLVKARDVEPFIVGDAGDGQHDPHEQAKKNRDQDYAIDLCDEVLGERALREHRFQWLTGDPGKSGARATLQSMRTIQSTRSWLSAASANTSRRFRISTSLM